MRVAFPLISRDANRKTAIFGVLLTDKYPFGSDILCAFPEQKGCVGFRWMLEPAGVAGAHRYFRVEHVVAIVDATVQQQRSYFSMCMCQTMTLFGASVSKLPAIVPHAARSTDVVLLERNSCAPSHVGRSKGNQFLRCVFLCCGCFLLHLHP